MIILMLNTTFIQYKCMKPLNNALLKQDYKYTLILKEKNLMYFDIISHLLALANNTETFVMLVTVYPCSRRKVQKKLPLLIKKYQK